MDIKALILDVDGVIVGEKDGYNFPHPNKVVVHALKQIQNNGTPISLCTAKSHFAITKEIRDADLNNIHIADGGGVIIDPINNIIIKQSNLPSKQVSSLIQALIEVDIYVEFYTADTYFIQESQAGAITEKHAKIVQSYPKQVTSLAHEALRQRITKLMPIAVNEAQKAVINDIFTPFWDKITFTWGTNPAASSLKFGIVTAKGISKRQGAIEISRSLHIPLENILGVGDSSNDWQFIELCGYGAAMGNASEELKDKVRSKGKKQGFIAPSVNENGILEVFRHFCLL